jgi:Iap family predicted aminopeptidase
MGTFGDRLRHHLEVLVEDIGARPPGSPANRRATDHVHGSLAAAGRTVTALPFTTRWWVPGTGWLEVDGARVAVDPNPYSPAGEVHGPAVRVGQLSDLEELEPDADMVLVLADDLAREQVLPAVFPFLSLPEHERIRTALHRLAPAAVVAVSDHWEPILEDPDLVFPSTTVPTAVGQTLATGDTLRLAVTGAVHPGTGVNLSTRLGAADPRLVLCAHLDSKATTPGAFDNAASVATLLALTELGHLDGLPLELVFFNGEDHIDSCGEMAWLAATDLDQIVGVVNVDGVGLAGQGISLASLTCPSSLETELATWVLEHPGWLRAEPWIESDHAIFAMRGIPAVALTSEDVHALLGELAHTPADTLEVLDLAVLEQLAADLPVLLALLADRLCHRAAG